MLRRLRLILLILLGVGTVGLSPAWGSPLPVGSLFGSKNAILDGQQPLPHTVVLSGDSLQVSEGMALLTLDQGNRMIVGRESDASFLRGTDGITVSLKRGNVYLYHPQAGTGVQVKAGDLTVAPVAGQKALGEIAMSNGLVVITARDGRLQVDGNGSTRQVEAGKTITLATTAARSHQPSPQGNSHISRKKLKALAIIAAGGTALALLISDVTGNEGNQASPAAP